MRIYAVKRLFQTEQEIVYGPLSIILWFREMIGVLIKGRNISVYIRRHCVFSFSDMNFIKGRLNLPIISKKLV